LLKDGDRCRIGNGESIPLLNTTPRLRNEVNSLITTPNQNSSGYLNVRDLIDEETYSLNASLICNIFNERDAHEILHIPLTDLGRKDEIIWLYDKKGLFFVKSAYRVCVDVLINKEEC
jgi:hypothetical protein